MEIGLAKMNIQQDLFFLNEFSEQEHIKIKSNSNCVEEIIDWETITISDFIDFLDFSDYEKFIIFTNKKSKRLNNIIQFIKSKVDLDLQISCIDSKSKFFEKTLEFDNKSEKEIISMYNNSAIAINTGFYNQLESVHIKHILVDNSQSIKSLDESIIENLGFNSLILQINNLNRLEDDYNFSKFMQYDDFINIIDTPYFENLNYEGVRELLMDFKKNGLIKYRKKILSDMGRFTSKKQLSTLFVFNNNIYYDKQKTMKLTNDIKTNIYQLINSINQFEILNEFNDDYIKKYFVMHTIVEARNEDLVFITYYNRYNYPPVKTNNFRNEFSNWIGYKNTNQYFVYNILNNKTFEVNEIFINLFEKIIKNENIEEDELELVKEIKHKLLGVD
ncbi:hypothetical protein BU090_09215 [Staphylococcus warneri]|uniref:hypothetical protein n=1 Tax=Staphylococcus warneri TaxID=1292 RepID=UPI000D1D3CF4|nr:hypothetical protein [Staphylococcus warneri]PTI59909.1 hypothetical protein BU090_09215 [Staphylococcus warneri]